MSEITPVFLLSLPRSGSTLLQRLLAAHSQVATVAEPWVLLAPLYALRSEGVYAEYGHRTAAKAVSGLLDQLPEGRGDYLMAVAAMASSIYERLAPPGTKMFLDKTPRYGLVVDDLIAAFPDAHFIVLHRNPLAVVASISSTFDSGSWKPYRHKQDLYLLSERLLRACTERPDAFTVVRYEQLLSEPETTMRTLVDTLGLEWEDPILASFTEVSVAGRVGDPTGVEQYDHLSSEPLVKWRTHLNTPIRKAWSRRYLKWLGSARLATMGYELHELMTELDEIPLRYSKLPADLANAIKGLVWSLGEVEIARDKLRDLRRLSRLFTHY